MATQKVRRCWQSPSRKTERGDPVQYPLIEADHDFDVTCYRADRRKAVPNDPENCIISVGIKRQKNVVECWISSNLDAYVAFRSPSGKEYAKHFTVGSTARKVLDRFDVDRSTCTTRVTLKAPARSHRLAYRRASGKKRNLAIKAGTHIVKPRKEPIRKIRVQRYDIGHRDRPVIVREVV